jgi:hypothetical protein
MKRVLTAVSLFLFVTVTAVSSRAESRDDAASSRLGVPVERRALARRTIELLGGLKPAVPQERKNPR